MYGKLTICLSGGKYCEGMAWKAEARQRLLNTAKGRRVGKAWGEQTGKAKQMRSRQGRTLWLLYIA